MHLRRALLLMAVVLIAAAAVQSLVPVPRSREPGAPRAAPEPPRAPPAAAPSRSLDFRFPLGKRPRTHTVPPGAHLTLRVSAASTGQVALPGLGQIQPVEPGTPAVFDVLAGRSGRYDVVFEPVVGRAVRVGRVSVSGSGRRP